MSLHTQDPDYRGFSGVLKTDMTIGQCARVEIEATVDDDEIMEIVVMYRGIDISDAMGDDTNGRIEYHLAANWSRLTAESDRKYAEESI